MAAPYDQELRQQQFIQDHPAWSIHAQDGASRFTAEKDDGANCHIVAHASLKALLDRLDEIDSGR